MVPRVVAGMVLLAVGFAVLAGCASPSSSPVPSAPTEPAGPSASAVPDVPEPTAVPARDEAPLVTACTITRTAANTALGYGLNPDAALGGPVSCPFRPDDANLTGYVYAVVEVQWAAQVGETSVTVVVGADCRPGDQQGAAGTAFGSACRIGEDRAAASPLRVVIGPDRLVPHADARPFVSVTADGASIQHDFDVRVSLFRQGPVGDGYTGFTLL